MSFVGRAEDLVCSLLQNPFQIEKIQTQVPIKELISDEEYSKLDPILQKHKFDLVAIRTDGSRIAIEVNYKHGNTAYKKWYNNFIPLLKDNGIIPAKIDDYDCRTLFDDDKEIRTYNDIRDVVDGLETSGVKFIE